ncbi:hypothetical protein CP533_6372 [Ophiocordyceps camponoti-saundersi (nom. inval.)]|nr:hypothetical protein CP533_6372 [Ophiocordyceps camponoti-saundersi (nom. inval.)]
MPRKKQTLELSEEEKTLTTTELRFIQAVFNNMTQKPDANWENVARELKLKDAKCAKERFRQMSVRHGWRDHPSTPRGAKRSAPSSVGSPDAKVKKAKRARRSKTGETAQVIKKEDSELDDVKADRHTSEDVDVKTDADSAEEDTTKMDDDTVLEGCRKMFPELFEDEEYGF